MKAGADLALIGKVEGNVPRGADAGMQSTIYGVRRIEFPSTQLHLDLIFHHCHGRAITHQLAVRQTGSYKI